MARDEGLRVGFYYSLIEWHHTDGTRCVEDEAAALLAGFPNCRMEFLDDNAPKVYSHGGYLSKA